MQWFYIYQNVIRNTIYVESVMIAHEMVKKNLHYATRSTISGSSIYTTGCYLFIHSYVQNLVEENIYTKHNAELWKTHWV